MGAANEDKTVQVRWPSTIVIFFILKPLYSNVHNNFPCSMQHFISRDLGEGFDFSNYNQLISKVMTNPKYGDMFGFES